MRHSSAGVSGRLISGAVMPPSCTEASICAAVCVPATAVGAVSTAAAHVSSLARQWLYTIASWAGSTYLQGVCDGARRFLFAEQVLGKMGCQG